MLATFCDEGYAVNLKNKSHSLIYDSIEVILKKEHPNDDALVTCFMEKFREKNLVDKIDESFLNNHEKLSKEIRPFQEEIKKDCKAKKLEEKSWFEIFFQSPTGVVAAVNG